MNENPKDRQADSVSDQPTKPAGQDVGPPEKRVDDEVDDGEGKTTKRQE